MIYSFSQFDLEDCSQGEGSWNSRGFDKEKNYQLESLFQIHRLSFKIKRGYNSIYSFSENIPKSMLDFLESKEKDIIAEPIYFLDQATRFPFRFVVEEGLPRVLIGRRRVLLTISFAASGGGRSSAFTS
jgi:hypothetical protein